MTQQIIREIVKHAGRHATSADIMRRIEAGTIRIDQDGRRFSNSRFTWTMDWDEPVSSTCECRTQKGRFCVHGVVTAAIHILGRGEFNRILDRIHLYDGTGALIQAPVSEAETRVQPEPQRSNAPIAIESWPSDDWGSVIAELDSQPPTDAASDDVRFVLKAQPGSTTLLLLISDRDGRPLAAIPDGISGTHRAVANMALRLPYDRSGHIHVEGAEGRRLLDVMLRDGLAVDADGHPYETGGVVAALDRWTADAQGRQTLRLVHAEDGVLVDVDGPMLVDGTAIHEVETSLPRAQAVRFASMGPLEPEMSGRVAAAIAKAAPDAAASAPRAIRVRRAAGLPRPSLEIDLVEGRRVARVSASYEGVPVDGLSGGATRTFDEAAGEVVDVERDADAERAIADAAEARGLTSDATRGVWEIPGDGGDEDAARFFADNAAEMGEAGWKVSAAGGWNPMGRRITHLELSAQDDGPGAYILDAIGDGVILDVFGSLAAIAESIPLEADQQDARRIVAARLKGDSSPLRTSIGEIVWLDNERIASLVVSLHHRLRCADVPSARPRMSGVEVADLLDLSGSVGLVGSEQLVRLMEAMRVAGLRGQEYDAPPEAWPEGFAGRHDPRQLFGAKWMRTLHDIGFGGLLADDVGYGKTVECILHVLGLKQDGLLDAPALVSVPCNAFGGWSDKLARLAPSLRVHHARWNGMPLHDDVDVVLTTHSTCKTCPELEGRAWSVLFLDEAQHARNPHSELAQWAARTPARQKIPVTATPAENRLEDFWSLAAIAAPGLLGTLTEFTTCVSDPIRYRRDTLTASRLNAMVAPFLLMRIDERRPEPLYEDDVVHLDAYGRQEYDIEMAATRARLQSRIDRVAATGVGASALHAAVLAALVHVRQICCDPRICKKVANDNGPDRDVREPSSLMPSPKTARVVARAEAIVGEGGRILVFSEFVDHLVILTRNLESVGIRTAQFHGRMTQRQKDAAVAAFKAGEIDVLLMTTKSGGSALDLDEATHVFMVDHWWNPMVERQAIGRATRDDHSKTVRVVRFVTESPIERGILEMQRRKRVLTGVLGPNHGRSLVEMEAAANLADSLDLMRSMREYDESVASNRMAA